MSSNHITLPTEMSCLHKNVNYEGKTVGCYEVLSFSHQHRFPSGQIKSYWRVRCIHCGNIKNMMPQRVIYQDQQGCQQCITIRFSGNNAWCWKNQDVKNVPGMYFLKIKGAAEKRKLNFEITREYTDDLFIKQNAKCVYTGYDLYFGNNRMNGNASLDRIDSKKGYVEDNVQWVHKDVNQMKWDLPHEQFLKICKLITENNNKND